MFSFLQDCEGSLSFELLNPFSFLLAQRSPYPCRTVSFIPSMILNIVQKQLMLCLRKQYKELHSQNTQQNKEKLGGGEGVGWITVFRG